MLTIGPSFTFEGDFYLIAGDSTAARQVIYELHQAGNASDLFAPFGATDSPAAGSVLSGSTPVQGCTFDDGNVAKVEILIDGKADGVATYGSSRPDVAAAYPNAPANVGYSYSLDTTKYSNRGHVLNVRVTDGAGNVAVLPDVSVTVTN